MPCVLVVGGDHAILELRKSCEEGSGMLRIISKEARQRICRRAPERHATCVAVGEGTEVEVATPC